MKFSLNKNSGLYFIVHLRLLLEIKVNYFLILLYLAKLKDILEGSRIYAIHIFLLHDGPCMHGSDIL